MEGRELLRALRRGSAAVSPGAVVIGGYVNGLGLVRALAARGIPTAVVTTQPFDIAQRSRWVSSHAAALGIEEQPELLVDALERRGSAWAGWALFPTNDGALAALARHWDRLSRSYRIVSPDPEVAPYLLDKERMLGAARAVGIDVPHVYGAAVEETAGLPDLRFPVLVKPDAGYRFFSRFESKLFVARDRDELKRGIARAAEAGIQCQVVDLVPGPDSRIYAHCAYVDERGEPAAGLTIRKLRQGPPFFGVTRVGEIVDGHAELREASIELLRRMRFRGMAMVEFKLDPRDGRARFMEVNGRSMVFNALLRRAGLNLGGLAWSDYVSGQPERVQPTRWPGVWINLHSDLLYSALYRRHDRVGLDEFTAPYRRPVIEAAWSPRDPLPFVAQWCRTAREAPSALLRGTHRDRLADRTRPAAA